MKNLIFFLLPLISYGQINLKEADVVIKGNFHTNLNIYGNGSIRIDDTKKDNVEKSPNKTFKAGVIDCGIQLTYSNKEKVKYVKKRSCYGFRYKYYTLLGQYIGNGEFSKGSYSKFPNTLKHKYVIVVFDNGYTKKLFIEN